jgi:predicted amino acid racemase
MIRGGVNAIADSRLANLERLYFEKQQKNGFDVPIMMLRQPMKDECGRAVEITDVALVSELEAVKNLSAAAQKLGKAYSIVVMVETGDLREGVLSQDLCEFIQRAAELPYITIAGIGTNVACLQGVPPTPGMLELLTGSAVNLRERLGLSLPLISGGNSSAWKLIESGAIPHGVNQFRFGEAVLLGQETTGFSPIPQTFQDAIVVEAEIIELKEKPVPDNGGTLRKRAILAIGRQDVSEGYLKPVGRGIEILRRSSDHLVVDVTDTNRTYTVGDAITFTPGYEALLAAMTSPYCNKVFIS